ncbi:hypothetical protein SteCoe_20503 [Stentor coeruleus]|uniref:RRM domain-containing protein n=1 Tax=Stentor coeruleus TaxID=5963 RepID=A0A1R2BRQ7_9CILI|nr:hypothetical protein SteCoe_20503 [Stentor coeruleus]
MSLENTRVFIGNIYFMLSTQELKQYFSKAGKILKIDLFIDEKAKSRGCGIIQYSTRKEAQNAIQLFHHKEIFNRIITVKEDESYYSQQHKPVQICVQKMPITVTWQQLKDVCREMGNVLRADVKIQNDGTSSGMVLFECYGEAIKAVELLNGAFFNGVRVEAYVDLNN